MEQSLGDIPWNAEADVARLAIFPGNPSTDSVKEGPEKAGIQPKVDTVGGNSAQDRDSPPETTGIHPKDRNPANRIKHTAIGLLDSK
ncbi:hypothetical protein R3P38DRAFT_3214541 [Favolaschia claudopus]|uniref:Uncharacterized protein n=1 Tax=Favolaschia claudopus TaxID=2862362 RepID=A0AAW0ACA2_9AGAR